MSTLVQFRSSFRKRFFTPKSMWWIFNFVVIRSQGSFTRATTAELSCHILNIVAIGSFQGGSEKTEIPSHLNCDEKMSAKWAQGVTRPFLSPITTSCLYDLGVLCNDWVRLRLVSWGVTYICVNELDHHWFQEWHVAYAMPNHYLNQW